MTMKKTVLLALLGLQLLAVSNISAHELDHPNTENEVGYTSFFKMPYRRIFKNYPPTKYGGMRLVLVKRCGDGGYYGTYI